MGIIAEYPLWLSIICIIIAAGVSLTLYYKAKDLREASSWVIKMLFSIRFLAVFFISFLFLSPFIERLTATVIKPTLVFAQDNSESIKMGTDSLESLSNKHYTDLKAFQERFENDYEIVNTLFGDEVRLSDSASFTDKYSDYDQLLANLSVKYSNKNLGAVILSGDGIFTKGTSPQYRANTLNAPIYSIALGDPTQKKDIRIAEVTHNKTAFAETEIPLEVFVEGYDMDGRETMLEVTLKGKVVAQEKITINSSRFFKKVPLQIKATKEGVNFFKVRLKPLANESSIANNTRTIAVDVIKNKEKILLLAPSPHPDLGAFAHAIRSNVLYEPVIITQVKSDIDYSDYSLVIAFQLPQKNFPKSELKRLKKAEIAKLFVVGRNTNINQLNAINSILNISTKGYIFNDSEATLNSNFSLFSTLELSDAFNEMPPLLTPFGQYKSNSKIQTLFYQKIKGISTKTPLLCFGEDRGSKVGFLLGEGIWKWRLSSYRKEGSHVKFDLLISKVIQYLSVRSKKDRFRIDIPKINDEGRPITVFAELYNASYEPENKYDVAIEITDGTNNYDYLMERNAKAYQLNLGQLPAGSYNYTGKVAIDEETLTRSGSFSVKPLNVEAMNTVANHTLLKKLSDATGGESYLPHQLDSLENNIRNNENIKPVLFETKKLTNIIQLKTLFFIILVLLSADWILRKYFGAY